MTPLERLLAEELPTGTFGGPRDRRHEPIPATVAAYHRTVLDTETAAYDTAHRGQRPPAHNNPDHQANRHLHPVPDTQETAA